jgi:MPBQ/MSBQ methyltransferase
MSARAAPEWSAQDVVRYFEVAGPDYAAWSPNFNMHFGYWARGMSFLAREPMLERMSEETLARLATAGELPPHLADLGCGLGATARHCARRSPRSHVTGLTIVPWQIANGNRLSAEAGLAGRVELLLADYCATPLADASVDGAYAIESACYASGADKSDLVAEMARIVRPGGRIAISDGFRKDSRALNPLLRAIYRIACRSWAVREMGDVHAFQSALERHGFEDVRVEDLSWRVAPSFAHVPFLCVKFPLARFLRGDFSWRRERWQNLMGPFFGAFLGLHRWRFGYYIVSATRSGLRP